MNIMADKILFWIDRLFVYYGIAKSLQEKYPCELYGIADIDETAKDFLDSQQTVKFKKIWFYPDNFQNREKIPDVEYLKKFEKKYDVNLWQIAYGDRHLLKETNRYYRFSRNEILLMFEQDCKFFEKILDEINPDFLITTTTSDHHDHLLYEMCKKRGIRVLMQRTSRMGYRSIISEEIDEIDEFENKRHGEYSSDMSLAKVEELFDEHSLLTQYKKIKAKYKIPKSEKLKAFLSFLINGNESNKRYVNFGKTRTKIFWSGTGIRNFRRKKNIQNFMEKKFLRKLDDTPFIYFPLHKEPERFLSIGTPYYANQKEMIKYLAKAIPVGYKLYVRDHPSMLRTTLWARSIDYYKEVLDLPNVEIIHSEFDVKEIFKKCSLVVTINGTSSLEAAIRNKPSIILTKTDFSDISSIIKVNKLEDLPKLIREGLKKKVSPAEVSRAMDKLYKNSIKIDSKEIFSDFHSRFYYTGFLKMPKYSNNELDDYIRKYKETFDRLADEHIRKISLMKKNN